MKLIYFISLGARKKKFLHFVTSFTLALRGASTEERLAVKVFEKSCHENETQSRGIGES